MSRGPGKLQRRMLAELEHGASGVLSLCERVFGSDRVSDAQYVSASRALRGLVSRGLASTLPAPRDDARSRTHYALPAEVERVEAAMRKELAQVMKRIRESKCSPQNGDAKQRL